MRLWPKRNTHPAAEVASGYDDYMQPLYAGGPTGIEVAWIPGGRTGDVLDWPWWLAPAVRPAYIRASQGTLPEPLSSSDTYKLQWAFVPAYSESDMEGVMPADSDEVPAWVRGRLTHEALRQHYALLLKVTGMDVLQMWWALHDHRGRDLTPISSITHMEEGTDNE